MAKIVNIEGMSVEEINLEVQMGAKFIVFEYCVSVIILTFRRGSDIYFIKPGKSAFKHGFPFTLITLFFGWWGIPWGPIHSIGALVTNFRGGKDITPEITAHFNASYPK
ncbi:MAG: hypothetical protein FWC57_05740 [Endomicrobia bacterium]|nr:hypothetical protein [Endomicrobiia bacterium]